MKFSIGTLIIITSLIIGNWKLEIGVVHAQDAPFPQPVPVACTDTKSPEFSSLRPYQASPCNSTLASTANFCGDTLSLTDTVSVIYNPAIDSCVSIGNGRVHCSYNVQVPTRTVSIDLSKAQLPIMGNTQDTENYKNMTSNLSDADKVNDYVSWYLNGTVFRSEDPYLFVDIPIPIIGPIASNVINSLYSDQLINYSGPLRKLLPFYEQLKIRSNVIQQAQSSVNGTTTDRHDQVVVCEMELFHNPFLGVSLVKGIPVPCNSVIDDALKVIFVFDNPVVNSMRLTDWVAHNKLPPLEDDKNADGTPKYKTRLDYWDAYQTWRGKLCGKLTIPSSILGLGAKLVGKYILGDNAMKIITDTFGSSIPDVSFLLCTENTANPNFYADLFPYVPFSSTEDATGSATINSVTISSDSDVTVSNPKTSFTNATLYFPHMEEDTQLASILQTTFAPKGADTAGAPTDVAAGSGSCQVADVRSGPGDSLFAGGISGTFSYTASFSCDFNGTSNNSACSGTCVPDRLECSDGGGVGGSGSCSGSQYCCAGLTKACSGTCAPSRAECTTDGGTAGTGSCSGSEYCCNLSVLGASTTGSDCMSACLASGKAASECGSECSSTAAPPTSTTGSDCMSTCLASGKTASECGSICTGATTNPTQTCTKMVPISLNISTETPLVDEAWSRLVAGPASAFKRIFPMLGPGSSLGSIEDIPASTNVTYSGAADGTGTLYFPHIGGIEEYFLNGIQTALRPKGYGAPLSFGPVTSVTGASDVCSIAAKYNIPCCQLQGILQVETGDGALIGHSTCNRSGQTVANCCTGNFCGPGNISCNQYSALDSGSGLDMCTDSGTAELMSRAMLLALCQADANLGRLPAGTPVGTCESYDWSKWGDYVTKHYSIQGSDYTAAAYYYGLGQGCTVDSCSQFRWGAGKGYCDAVKSYCDSGAVLPQATDVTFCSACNATLPASSPKIECTKF